MPPARIWSNLLLRFWAVIFNSDLQRSKQNSLQIYIKKNNFSKSRDSQTSWRDMFTLMFNIHFLCLLFYIVLLLTSHSTQKFYLLIHVGHWLLLQLVTPKGAHSANVRCIWNIFPRLLFPPRTVQFRSRVRPWCGASQCSVWNALARAKEVRSGSGLEIRQA